MELSSRVVEVRALAATLWFIPPPGRAMIADKLHGLGVRVHPELATLKLERQGPASLGNHAPQTPVKFDRQSGVEMLRSMGNHDLADRIEAADTEEKQAAERQRLKAPVAEALKVIPEVQALIDEKLNEA